MRVLYWCMLAVTILLLVCEVTISQLCKSLITLVNGFHTLFILMCMALPHPPPHTASRMKHPLSSLDFPASAPHKSSSSVAPPSTLPADPPSKPLPGTQTATDGQAVPDQPPTPQPNYEAASLVNCHQLYSSDVSHPALTCGMSYSNSRIQPVGAFFSALLLASLCISYLIEIISFSLDPHPVQRPLMLVVVGALSLLHKMLLLRLNWDQLHDGRTGVHSQPETESHIEVNHKVLAEEKTKGWAEPERVLDDISQVQSAVDDLLHHGALVVLCNPGTSSIPDTDSQTIQEHPEVQLHAAASCVSRDADVVTSVTELKAHTCERLSKDITDISTVNANNTDTPVPSSQRPVCLLSFLFVTQGLFTSLLALINSLVMFLIRPQYLHSAATCNFLVYLDPGLSLLAVIVLIATARPQMCRYGLLLLQATPPHICVSELEQRIVSVPGVQAVHDLHIWQLAESLMVASVHVHCSARFPTHRCADLMSGVTKVLQSVGVSCCTIQPEFASCSVFSPGCGCDASPVVHREDPSLPPLLACSLACGKACAGSMCCSSLEEEARSLLAPPAGESMEEAQTLVVENTFL